MRWSWTRGAAGRSWQHGEGSEVCWEEELSLSPHTGTEQHWCYCLVLFLWLSDCDTMLSLCLSPAGLPCRKPGRGNTVMKTPFFPASKWKALIKYICFSHHRNVFMLVSRTLTLQLWNELVRFYTLERKIWRAACSQALIKSRSKFNPSIGNRPRFI